MSLKQMGNCDVTTAQLPQNDRNYDICGQPTIQRERHFTTRSTICQSLLIGFATCAISLLTKMMHSNSARLSEEGDHRRTHCILCMDPSVAGISPTHRSRRIRGVDGGRTDDTVPSSQIMKASGSVMKQTNLILS